MTIRQLTPEDAEAYLVIRKAALRTAPLAFLSSESDDRFQTIEAAAPMLRGDSGSLAYGAFAPELVGMAGLFREPRTKVAHRVHVWGMFVDPAHRGTGLGGRLLEAVTDHARRMDGIASINLSVTSAAPAARRIYEKAGFRIWGTEPDAMRLEGTSVDEYHMTLPLTDA